MANTTNFSVRMDSEVKKQCEALYNDLGMTLTTAINVFLRQSLRVGGLPFELRQEQPKMHIVTATELQNNFGKYLQLVQGGEEVCVLKNGKEVARLISIEKSVSFLSDSLLGVLKNDYDEKAMRAKGWNRRCPT